MLSRETWNLFICSSLVAWVVGWYGLQFVNIISYPYIIHERSQLNKQKCTATCNFYTKRGKSSWRERREKFSTHRRRQIHLLQQLNLQQSHSQTSMISPLPPASVWYRSHHCHLLSCATTYY